LHETGCAHGGEELCREEEEPSNSRESACEDHAERYRGIKQSSTDPIKRPRIHQQTKPIHERREDILLTARLSVRGGRLSALRIEHDLAGKRKVEKHECSDEFPDRCDDVTGQGAELAFLGTSGFGMAGVRVVVRVAVGIAMSIVLGLITMFCVMASFWRFRLAVYRDARHAYEGTMSNSIGSRDCSAMAVRLSEISSDQVLS